MGHLLDFPCKAAIGALTIAALAGPAHALLIVPTFDSSLTSQGNAVALEAAINTAVSTIDGLYSNPGTVNILFRFNSGVLGESITDGQFIDYPGDGRGEYQQR